MFAVAFLSVTLVPLVAVVLLSPPQSKPPNRVRRVAGIATFLIPLLVFGMLLFARPTSCHLLGGDWHRHNCQHEWSSNGD